LSADFRPTAKIKDEPEMRLAAISMIRDEADIIAPFLRHLAALFDVVFLLDQRSSDGTSEVMLQACTSRPGWFYYYMDFAGRHQKEVNAIFMVRAFEQGADAVFFIDCDEFVEAQTKAALQQAASNLNEQLAVGVFSWRACVPKQFDRWSFDPTDSMWIADRNGSFPKAAIPRSVFLSFPGIRISQGNHFAIGPDGKEFPTRVKMGHFFHVPVRSRQQFLQKVFVSAIANFAKNNFMAREGVHKRRLLEIIAERDLSDAALASIAAQFPGLSGFTFWNEPDDLTLNGFTKRAMEIPLADFPLPEPPKADFHKVIARCLKDYRLENLEDGEGYLEIEENIVRYLPKSLK
jgi:hypothetical protein